MPGVLNMVTNAGALSQDCGEETKFEEDKDEEGKCTVWRSLNPILQLLHLLSPPKLHLAASI